jgi:hypothetical protein
MAFVKLVVLPVPEGLRLQLDYAARIFAASDTQLRNHATVIGKLGDQPIDGLEVQGFGTSVSGFVKQMPQVGDELSLAVDNAELDAIGLKFTGIEDGPIA